MVLKKHEINFDWGIIGHRSVSNVLSSHLANGLPGHAYLFVGQDKLGKLTIAKKLAQSILCNNFNTNNSKLPCQNCKSCLEFINNLNSDFYLVQKRIDKKNIIISQIIDLQKSLNLKSSRGSHKVVLIDSAQNLNTEAANRLLKILEEPHDKILFILIADSLKNILPTIRSRCQIIKFFPLKNQDILKYLHAKNRQNFDKNLLISLSLGKPGLVIEFLQDPIKFQQAKDDFEKILSLFDNNFSKNIAYAKIIVRGGLYNVKLGKFDAVIKILTTILRDIYLIKIGMADYITYEYYLKKLEKIAYSYTFFNIFSLQYKLLNYTKNLVYNPDLNLLTTDLIYNLNFKH